MACVALRICDVVFVKLLMSESHSYVLARFPAQVQPSGFPPIDWLAVERISTENIHCH